MSWRTFYDELECLVLSVNVLNVWLWLFETYLHVLPLFQAEVTTLKSTSWKTLTPTWPGWTNGAAVPCVPSGTSPSPTCATTSRRDISSARSSTRAPSVIRCWSQRWHLDGTKSFVPREYFWVLKLILNRQTLDATKQIWDITSACYV